MRCPAILPTMNKPLLHATVDVGDPRLHWLTPEEVVWPDERTRDWLSEQGSLTRLLKLTSAGRFSVQVLNERRQQIQSAKLRAEFGPLAENHSFWSRQVALYGNEEPWVLAHTLLPAHSEMSELAQVRTLGSKPLGEFLFDHPELTRSHLHFTQLPSGIWGRKSLFFLFGKPIMVAEFFLPELLKHSLPL